MSKLRQLLERSADDRGAIVVLFVVLLATGVLLATAGLVVDLGRTYVHQKNVQRAADEVAQALALHCDKTAINTNCLTNTVATVTATGTTSQSVTSFLNGVANPRGNDGYTVTKTCGYSVRNLGLPACPALTAAKTDCKVAMSSSTEWVRVYVTAPPLTRLLGDLQNDNNTYQDTACAESYYGKVGAIKIDSTTSPLPFVVGFCEIAHDSSAQMMIIGESNESSCTVTDRNNTSFSANGRGWRVFNTASSPATNAYCWTISTVNGCTTVALSTKTTSTSVYTTFLNLVKANLNKANLVPVVDKVGTLTLVKGFASFKLQGFKFPTISGILPATTTVTPTGYVWPSNGNCSGTATTSSKWCIVGIFENKVSTPYGNNRAVTITNDPSVPDFGFTIIKHGY
mgnify:CR=1 FL=1